MKPLPPALLNPKDGRYTAENAVRVWMHVYHGIAYDEQTKGRAYALARTAAYRELAPIMRSADTQDRAPDSTKTRLDRRPYAHTWVNSPPDWQLGRPRQYVGQYVGGRISRPSQWVEHADLVAFAARHGISLDGAEPTPALQPAPKTKPGPKPKNNEAVEYAEQLIEHGMQRTQAAMEAAEKFRGNADSIARTLRRRRNEQ